jgi:hypothetical protein
MENNNSSMPKYLALINNTQKGYQTFKCFMKQEGFRFAGIVILFIFALVGIAYVANLQLGAGWYNLLIIACLSSFSTAMWEAKKIVDFDRLEIHVPTWRRKLVLMHITSAVIGILTVTTLSTCTQYSFLSNSISKWSVMASVTNIFAGNEDNTSNTGVTEMNFEEIPNTAENIEEGGPAVIKVARKAKSNSKSFADMVNSKEFKEMQYRFFLRNFMEREGFSAKRYWDKAQWSIGFGSKSSKNDNRTLTKKEAYLEAQIELQECRKKAKLDFPWLSYNQELVVMDLYYNAGQSSITGYKGLKGKGETFAVFKKYEKDPNSITIDDLYSAFVADKSCNDCENGKSCGHKSRKLRNAYQFLSSRSEADHQKFIALYEKLVTSTSPLAMN